MAVSPDQLRSLRFDEGLRGYDKRQVDKVISRVADLVEDLQNRLAEAEGRAAAAEARVVERAAGPSRSAPSTEASELDETLRRTLVLAQRTADAAVKEAREEAEQIRDEARAEADAVLGEARARAGQLSEDAEAQRASILAEAEAEAARIVDGARQDCQDRIERVEAELAEAHQSRRDELVEQIAQLSEVRRSLADDVERLEAHVTRRREAIRGALDELAAVLDDPDKLVQPPPPPTSGAEAPDPAGFVTAPLAVAAMDEFPTVAGGPRSASALLLGEVAATGTGAGEQAAAGPDTAWHGVVDADADAGDGEPWEPPPVLDPSAEEPARPAWADAVPPADAPAAHDPFLDELRRASGDDDAALDRFFDEADEERRSGWFRRRG
jgi:DivIVA domain-containing protein